MGWDTLRKTYIIVNVEFGIGAPRCSMNRFASALADVVSPADD